MTNINYYFNRALHNEFKGSADEALTQGYNYIVRANDKFLSGWGNSAKSGHQVVVLCKDLQQALQLMGRMTRPGNMLNYITRLSATAKATPTKKSISIYLYTDHMYNMIKIF